MQTIVLIIVSQVVVTLLTGCSVFQNKIEEMDRLNCKPVDSEMCLGWEVGEF